MMAFSAASVTSRFMSILLGDSRLGALQAPSILHHCSRKRKVSSLRASGRGIRGIPIYLQITALLLSVSCTPHIPIHERYRASLCVPSCPLWLPVAAFPFPDYPIIFDPRSSAVLGFLPASAPPLWDLLFRSQRSRGSRRSLPRVVIPTRSEEPAF
jgi:hypothetical protein